MTESDIPENIRNCLGASTKERLDTMMNDIIYNSLDQGEIRMSGRTESGMMALREYMYENLYTNSEAKTEEKRVPYLLTSLYRYYQEHIDEMPSEYVRLIREGETEDRTVCDFISGMTDPYALERFTELFIPRRWPGE